MSYKVIRHLCADTTSRFIIATIQRFSGVLDVHVDTRGISWSKSRREDPRYPAIQLSKSINGALCLLLFTNNKSATGKLN